MHGRALSPHGLGLAAPHDSGNSYPSLSLKKVHGEVCECTVEVCDCTVEGMFHVVLTCSLNLFLCEIAWSRQAHAHAKMLQFCITREVYSE